MVLWDNARLVPCDSHLWAIHATHVEEQHLKFAGAEILATVKTDWSL